MQIIYCRCFICGTQHAGCYDGIRANRDGYEEFCGVSFRTFKPYFRYRGPIVGCF